MMQYIFFIDNDKLICQKFRTVYTGNVNTYECLFQIRSEIDGLTWFCVFKQGDKVYQNEIINNSCIIPHEVLEDDATALQIGCYAVNFNESDYKRISTGWVNISPKKGAYCEATAPEIPSPDVWETLVLKSVPYIGSNGNWFIYSLKENKYIDSGVIASGGGGGSPVDAYTKEETGKLLEQKLDVSNVVDIPPTLDGGFRGIDCASAVSVQEMFMGASNLLGEVSSMVKDNRDRLDGHDTQIGNIETALDSIIAIQNGLIGGGEV